MGDAKASSENAAKENCDILAGHGSDTTLKIKPTAFADLKKHTDKALAACLIASKDFNPRYIYQLGRTYMAAGNEVKAWKYYQEAANRGHLFSRYRVANAYQEGKYGIEKNVPKALKLYKELVDDGGDPNAGFQVARIYHIGKYGVEKDLEKAFQYYTKAEKDEIIFADFYLGLMYQFGRGVEKDKEIAIKHYKKSVKATSYRRADAQKNLADMILRKANNNWENILFLNVLSQSSLSKIGKKRAPNSELDQNRSDFSQAMRYLRDRRGNSKSYHDDYIYELRVFIRQMIMQKEEFQRLSWDGTAAKAAKKLTLTLNTWAIDLLEEALSTRYKTFPDDYPNQSPKGVEKAMKDLQRSENNLLAFYKEYWGFNRYERKTKTTSCIDASSRWDGDIFKMTLKNKCKYSVDLQVKIWFEGYSSRFKIFEGSASVGKSRTFQIAQPSGYNGQRVRIRWGSCFSRMGFSEPLNPEFDKISCGRGMKSKIQKEYSRLETTLLTVLKSISSGG